jgi:hypothetical protein
VYLVTWKGEKVVERYEKQMKIAKWRRSKGKGIPGLRPKPFYIFKKKLVKLYQSSK